MSGMTKVWLTADFALAGSMFYLRNLFHADACSTPELEELPLNAISWAGKAAANRPELRLQRNQLRLQRNRGSNRLRSSLMWLTNKA